VFSSPPIMLFSFALFAVMYLRRSMSSFWIVHCFGDYEFQPAHPACPPLYSLQMRHCTGV
jgi:hypothetical protein